MQPKSNPDFLEQSHFITVCSILAQAKLLKPDNSGKIKFEHVANVTPSASTFRRLASEMKCSIDVVSASQMLDNLTAVF